MLDSWLWMTSKTIISIMMLPCSIIQIQAVIAQLHLVAMIQQKKKTKPCCAHKYQEIKLNLVHRFILFWITEYKDNKQRLLAIINALKLLLSLFPRNPLIVPMVPCIKSTLHEANSLGSQKNRVLKISRRHLKNFAVSRTCLHRIAAELSKAPLQILKETVGKKISIPNYC